MAPVREYTLSIFSNPIGLTVVFLTEGGHILWARDRDWFVWLVTCGDSVVILGSRLLDVSIVLDGERLVLRVPSGDRLRFASRRCSPVHHSL